MNYGPNSSNASNTYPNSSSLPYKTHSHNPHTLQSFTSPPHPLKPQKSTIPHVKRSNPQALTKTVKLDLQQLTKHVWNLPQTSHIHIHAYSPKSFMKTSWNHAIFATTMPILEPIHQRPQNRSRWPQNSHRNVPT